MNPPVYIYGLVRKADRKVLYVGQTYYPRTRHPQKPDVGVAILRVCSRQNALRVEAQIIRAYQRRGECLLNRNKGLRTYRPLPSKALPKQSPKLVSPVVLTQLDWLDHYRPDGSLKNPHAVALGRKGGRVKGPSFTGAVRRDLRGERRLE